MLRSGLVRIPDRNSFRISSLCGSMVLMISFIDCTHDHVPTPRALAGAHSFFSIDTSMISHVIAIACCTTRRRQAKSNTALHDDAHL